MRNSIDLHGYDLIDAETEVHLLVGAVLVEDQGSQILKFITGRGPVREMVLRVLREEYKLEPIQELGNPGVIRVEVPC